MKCQEEGKIELLRCFVHCGEQDISCTLYFVKNENTNKIASCYFN